MLCVKMSKFPAKEHAISTEDQYRHLFSLMDECVERIKTTPDAVCCVTHVYFFLFVMAISFFQSCHK